MFCAVARLIGGREGSNRGSRVSICWRISFGIRGIGTRLALRCGGYADDVTQ